MEIAHRHGKQVVLHMCGLLFHLLDDIRETGCDGINALTPAPVGDTTVETVLDRYGEDFLVLGTSLPGGVFQLPNVTGSQIQEALQRYYTPRVKRANVLLCLGADGRATPLERFLAARDWYEAHGAR